MLVKKKYSRTFKMVCRNWVSLRNIFSKLREIIDTAIDNESKLMDITISLGNAQRNLNSIFDDAARSSRMPLVKV